MSQFEVNRLIVSSLKLKTRIVLRNYLLCEKKTVEAKTNKLPLNTKKRFRVSGLELENLHLLHYVQITPIAVTTELKRMLVSHLHLGYYGCKNIRYMKNGLTICVLTYICGGLSWPTSGPKFCVVWLRKRPASGFRMRITLGVVLIRSLVFHVCVSPYSRNGSGVRPYLWVQEKFVWFRQSTQNARLCPAELLGQFFSDSAFNLLRNLCDTFLVNSRNRRVSWLAVPRIFLLHFSCNGCQLSFVSQCCHLFEGKTLRNYEDWISFRLLINLRL